MHVVSTSRAIPNVTQIPKTSRIRHAARWSAAAVLWLALLLVPAELAAQEKPDPGESADKMWFTEGLPSNAVVRYGALGRSTSSIGIYALQFSHDGKLLAARDRGHAIRILDLEKQEMVCKLPTPSSSDFAFSPDNKFIVTGNRNESQIWSIEKAEAVRDQKHAGYRIASSTETNDLVLVGSGKVSRYRWPLPSKPVSVEPSLTGRKIVIGLSQNGKFVVFHNGRNVEILDTTTGQPILPAPPLVPRRAIVSPNGNLLGELNRDDKLNLFDLRNAKKYRYILQSDSRLYTATFSADNRFLYTAHYDKSIIVWDLVTMQKITRVAGHANEIQTLASHPQRMLALASGASGSVDRSVIYWELRERVFPPIEDLSDFDLDVVWYDLASEEAKVSLAATNILYQKMQQDPEVIDELTAKLGLDAGSDDRMARGLIDNLDDRKYQVREKATSSLKSMVDQIRPLLEKELELGSQEARWRILEVLKMDHEKPSTLTKDGRRKHRVVLALELCGTSGTKGLLSRISSSVVDKNIVELANEALQRLAK